MNRSSLLLRAAIAATPLLLLGSARADIPLGPFFFNENQFGDSLTASDGGIHAASNWLNVVNANPGNPGYLTGPNFDTGIANIADSDPAYTIYYDTPIANVAGNDLGVVVARFSTDDFLMAVSTDGGATFSADVLVPNTGAVPTAVEMRYFYAGSGPVPADLYVHPLDLSMFGVGLGESIDAVRISGIDELDLIRVAGFAVIPEPGTIALASLGALALLAGRRRQRAKL